MTNTKKNTEVIEEGIVLPFANPKKVSRELKVFYNPDMKENRDICIAILKELEKTYRRKLRIGLPLAGSGVRAARIAHQIKHVERFEVNDHDPRAYKTIQEVLRKNKLESKVNVSKMDASEFLIHNLPFDYIDLDPFGSPNEFLPAACKAIADKGILAVTATDTSALCGTHRKAARRKYDAKLARNPFMHETGIRALIRTVQLVGAQYELALQPVVSYAKLHYMRIYFQAFRKRSIVDKDLDKHKAILFSEDNVTWKVVEPNESKYTIGPVWTGNLGDSSFVKKILQHMPEQKNTLLEKLEVEYSKNAVGYVHIPFICKALKVDMRPISEYLQTLKGVRTHFDPQGIRTEYSARVAVNKIKKMYEKKK